MIDFRWSSLSSPSETRQRDQTASDGRRRYMSRSRTVVFPDAFAADAAEKIEILLHDAKIQQGGGPVNCDAPKR